jgi:hypothetical protein
VSRSIASKSASDNPSSKDGDDAVEQIGGIQWGYLMGEAGQKNVGEACLTAFFFCRGLFSYLLCKKKRFMFHSVNVVSNSQESYLMDRHIPSTYSCVCALTCRPEKKKNFREATMGIQKTKVKTTSVRLSRSVVANRKAARFRIS